jgi:hypothetical protein
VRFWIETGGAKVNDQFFGDEVSENSCDHMTHAHAQSRLKKNRCALKRAQRLCEVISEE